MRTGFIKPVIGGLSIFLVLGLLVTDNARAEKMSHGEQLYAENCQACHLIGKNIIKPKKTILSSKKLNSIGEFKSFLSRQNGEMPPYKTIVNNRNDLHDLYKYIKDLNQSESKTN